MAVSIKRPINGHILVFVLMTIIVTYLLWTKGQTNKDSTETYALEQRYMKYLHPKAETANDERAEN
jgi:hypothetical protein